MSIRKESFGRTSDGQPVDLYVLAAGEVEARIMTLGATWVGLTAPDREGKLADVVLGYDTVEEYLNGPAYFGAICGRYANRIAGASFELDGKRYNLPVNNGPNSLHGGAKGFDKYIWSAKIAGAAKAGAAGGKGKAKAGAKSKDSDEPALELRMTSPDGDQGYPGTLSVSVTYTLTRKNELRLDYEATTDQPTVLNLTNHAYFNLAGHGSGDILNHVIQLHATGVTEVGEGLIPTGRTVPVAGTPMDFTRPRRIGESIEADHPQMKLAGGYDMSFPLDTQGKLGPAAEVGEPASGRVMRVLTTEPAVQLYTGNFMKAGMRGKGGATYGRRGGLCLETQHYPDSPHFPSFPTTVLRPGEVYRQTTVYAFETGR